MAARLTLLIALVPLLPFLGAALLALGVVTGRIAGEVSERVSARLALGVAGLSFATAGVVTGLRAAGVIPNFVQLGTWLTSGHYRIDIEFAADPLSLGLSVGFSLLLWLTARFAVNYLHREPGFHRFFLILCLFAGAMQCLVLAGNAVLTFVGWELAGVCSYLLIAYAYDRRTAAANATRAFVTNRIGDAAFILGIYLAFVWCRTSAWPDLVATASGLPPWQAGLLAGSFLLAAIAKSAQFPLSPWLARAMEGPTPSSAVFYGGVMIHAGVYLVLRLQPVFEHSPVAMAVLMGVGLITAIYGYLCGLVQADVKSALAFSALAQVGLMFLECGLGWWSLATVHLFAHAIFRFYQFLTAPELMHQIIGAPPRPVALFLARRHWLFLPALRRFWLEELGDEFLVKPVRRIAADLQTFDDRVVDPFIGLTGPAIRGLSSLAEWEEHHLAAVAPARKDAASASGLPGMLVHGLAGGLHWFEQRLLLEGAGGRFVHWGRKLGIHLNRIEAGLTEPRYLVLLLLATLLATL